MKLYIAEHFVVRIAYYAPKRKEATLGLITLPCLAWSKPNIAASVQQFHHTGGCPRVRSCPMNVQQPLVLVQCPISITSASAVSSVSASSSPSASLCHSFTTKGAVLEHGAVPCTEGGLLRRIEKYYNYHSQTRISTLDGLHYLLSGRSIKRRVCQNCLQLLRNISEVNLLHHHGPSQYC